MKSMVEQQRLLESFSEEQLAKEGREPSGMFALVMIPIELQRRKTMREGHQQMMYEAQPTVTQSLLAEAESTGALGGPGIPQIDQGTPSQDPGMQQGIAQFANGGLVGPNILQEQIQTGGGIAGGFAGGGLIGYQGGDLVGLNEEQRRRMRNRELPWWHPDHERGTGNPFTSWGFGGELPPGTDRMSRTDIMMGRTIGGRGPSEYGRPDSPLPGQQELPEEEAIRRMSGEMSDSPLLGGDPYSPGDYQGYEPPDYLRDVIPDRSGMAPYSPGDEIPDTSDLDALYARLRSDAVGEPQDLSAPRGRLSELESQYGAMNDQDNMHQAALQDFLVDQVHEDPYGVEANLRERLGTPEEQKKKTQNDLLATAAGGIAETLGSATRRGDIAKGLASTGREIRGRKDTLEDRDLRLEEMIANRQDRREDRNVNAKVQMYMINGQTQEAAERRAANLESMQHNIDLMEQNAFDSQRALATGVEQLIASMEFEMIQSDIVDVGSIRDAYMVLDRQTRDMRLNDRANPLLPFMEETLVKFLRLMDEKAGGEGLGDVGGQTLEMNFQ